MHVIILVLSHDLGNALIFFIVYIMMLYVATCRFFYVIAGTIAGSGAACIAYRFFSHVRVRVQAYLDPWSFIDTGGYQVTQSLFAIGTGGLLGLGLYKGAPKTIPVVEEDFIFSAISEELGMIFAISLVILYINCFICFIKISMKQTELFYKLIGLGLAVTYAVQTILTVGGAIKFIPSTGVTLPLISYGGSSVLCTMISFAIIQGLEVRRNVLEEAYEEDNDENDNKTYDNEDAE
jgi:cell division protein FtsW (lipid II flippase)